MTSEIEYTCNNCGHEGTNTRAVPDVPDLVRYDPNNKTYPYFEMEESELGEYVRYDQAAEILAAKDAAYERMKIESSKHAHDAETVRRERDALIVELAQIKAQEPVATVEWKAVNGRRVKQIYPITLDNVEAGTPLFAAPVDQTADPKKVD